MAGLRRINSNLEDRRSRAAQSLVVGAKLFVLRMGAGEPVPLTTQTRRTVARIEACGSLDKIKGKCRRCLNRRSRTAPIRTFRSLRACARGDYFRSEQKACRIMPLAPSLRGAIPSRP